MKVIIKEEKKKKRKKKREKRNKGMDFLDSCMGFCFVWIFGLFQT